VPLIKKGTWTGLKDHPSIQVRDSSPFSDGFFNVVKFPDKLTAGKNLFKIRMQNQQFVDDSEVFVEVLDYNENAVYYEPLQYVEKDGTRVIAIYIYPNTSPGTATVYLAGRLEFLSTGERIPFSNEWEDPNYKNIPNILWSREVPIAPYQANDTEIIFTTQPQLTISEVVQPYLQPVEMFNVFTELSASGATVNINPIPSTVPGGPIGPGPSNQGGMSANTPNVGVQFFNISAIQSALQNSAGSTAGSAPLSTIIGESQLTTTNFQLSQSMVGGLFTVVNPNIIVPEDTLLNSSGKALPSSQLSQATQTSGKNPSTKQLSGSYNFAIMSVQNSTTAMVGQYAGFANNNDNTNGPFSVTVNSGDVPIGNQYPFANTNTSINISHTNANFTASFIKASEVVYTQNSSSFADIIIADAEPDTGDVYRIKTLYKPSGFFGDFIDLGDTILERQDILIDTGSLETNIAIGAFYENFGLFEDYAEITKYWSGSLIGDVNAVTSSYDFETLIGAANLEVDWGGPIDTANRYISKVNAAACFSIKDEYKPTVYTNTTYIVKFQAGLSPDIASYSSDDINLTNARVDVYVRGVNVTPQLLRNVQLGDLNIVPNFEHTINGVFEDGKGLGTRIGTIQARDIPALTGNIELTFRAEGTGPANFIFVVRRGEWLIGNIRVLADKQTGFSPGTVRISKRIPTEHLQTPLTFKFQYYDYRSNKADLETVAYGAVFNGGNSYTAGTSNLITGSVTIGSSIGAGIEMAGMASGYLRSIGYEGYTSASLGKAGGGFLLWSGSNALELGVDTYQGVGLELVGHEDKSHLIFKTSGSGELDIKAERFYIGTSGSQFISGANSNIEISSSIFHLDPQNDLLVIGADAIIEGDLTANSIRTPATIGGSPSTDSNASSSITSDGFASFKSASIAGFTVNTEEIKSSNDSLRLKAIGEITGSDVFFTGGKIANFNIDGHSLSTTGVEINDSTQDIFISSSNFKVSHQGDITASNVDLAGKISATSGDIGGFSIDTATISSSNNNLILRSSGVITGSDVFFTGGEIGGFTLTSDKITGNNIIIDSAGSIQTSDYTSDLKGWKLSAANNGFLEVENAKIRGTLSTAVFEKETVNAVGGQLYVANSTTLTSSALHPADNYLPTDSTMSVVNVTGFAVDEILTLKKVTNTGFSTEYIRIQSASRNDGSSENDFSGNIYVLRGYSGSLPTSNTSSLGGIAGSPQSYSGSQVIVSTGTVGTGFIRLNANPNNQATPYIDIVERTGSAIYDVDLKARLGDLSGITDTSFTDGVTGFGLYTSKGYFKGKLEITDPTDNSANYNFGGVSGSTIPVTKLVPDSQLTGSQWKTNLSTKHRVENGVLFVSSSNSGSWNGQLRSNQQFHRTGDHTLVADITITDIGWYPVSEPRMMIGFKDAALNSTNTYGNGAHYIYFATDDISIYQGTTAIGSLVSNGVAEGDQFRLLITPLLDGGARYRAFKYPNLSGSIGDVTSTNDGSPGDLFEIGIAVLAETETFHIDNIQVTAPGQKSTVIDGNSVTTGKIRSSNFGGAAGSEFDLDEGTFQLGGSSSPKLEWDGSDLSVDGTVTATAGSIGGWTINSTNLVDASNKLKLEPAGTYIISSSDFQVSTTGEMTASAGEIGGFKLSSTEISASNLILKSSGQITGSNVYFDGGKIGGTEIQSTKLLSTASLASPDLSPKFQLDADGTLSGSNLYIRQVIDLTGSPERYPLLDTRVGLLDGRNLGRQIISNYDEISRGNVDDGATYNVVNQHYFQLLPYENVLMISFQHRVDVDANGIQGHIRFQLQHSPYSGSFTADTNWDSWTDSANVTSTVTRTSAGTSLYLWQGGTVKQIAVPTAAQAQTCRLQVEMCNNMIPPSAGIKPENKTTLLGYSVVATRALSANTAGAAADSLNPDTTS